MKFFDRPA